MTTLLHENKLESLYQNENQQGIGAKNMGWNSTNANGRVGYIGDPWLI